MNYQHRPRRRATQPAAGRVILHPPTIEPRPRTTETTTQCRATMGAEDYAAAILAAYHAALAMYAHEPPNAAVDRLNAVTEEADQWEDPRRPRKRKEAP